MDAVLHEVDPVLFLIPFKGSFRQIYIKILKHKRLLPVPLYTDIIRFAIQLVLQIQMITKMQIANYFKNNFRDDQLCPTPTNRNFSSKLIDKYEEPGIFVENSKLEATSCLAQEAEIAMQHRFKTS